jgi:hypothetical protein
MRWQRATREKVCFEVSTRITVRHKRGQEGILTCLLSVLLRSPARVFLCYLHVGSITSSLSIGLDESLVVGVSYVIGTTGSASDPNGRPLRARGA